MKWLVCLLFGHDWSMWQPVVPMRPDGADEIVWAANGWTVRLCQRGHFEKRGFDWEDAPLGVVSLPGGLR